MKNILRALLLILFSAIPALAQNSTTLTINVTDAGSVAWANGTYTLTFVGQANSTWPGGNLARTFTGSLNSSGVAAPSIPNNNTITPSPSFWTVQVCPNPVVSSGPSGCYTLASQTITGATQTLNVTPPAIVISVPTTPVALPPITAYVDAEISGGFVNFSYYNLTLANNRQCIALPCSSNWSSPNGGGTSSPNQGTFNVSSSCGTQPNCFQTPWNTQNATTCNWTNTTAVVNCTSGPFTAADVGKNIAGFSTCATSLGITSTNPIGATATTITSFNSATQVGISQTPTAAIASAGCIYWGSPDDTALSQVDTALASAATTRTCPSVTLPMGYGWVASPHFFTNSTACLNTPEELGASYVTFGQHVIGKGPQNTVMFLPPTFAFASCTHGADSLACFGGDYFFDSFGITMGGFNGSGVSTTAKIVELGGASNYGSVFHFSCANVAAAAPNITGLEANSFHGVSFFTSIDGCGSTGTQILGSAALLAGYTSFEDSKTFQINNAGGFTSLGGNAFQPSPQSSSVSDVVRNSGAMNLTTGDGCFVNGNVTSQLNCYHGFTGSLLFASGQTSWTVPNVASSIAIRIDAGSVHIMNSAINAGSGVGSLGVYLNGTTAQYFDMGGNVYTGTGTVSTGVTSGFTFAADGHSVKGTCTGTASSSSTLGLYGTGSNETTTTCSSTTIGAGLVMSGVRTLQNLIVTAGTAGFSASSGVFTVLQNGNATSLTCTVGTSTICADSTHSVTTADGDLISIRFTTQATETLANIKAIVEWN